MTGRFYTKECISSIERELLEIVKEKSRGVTSFAFDFPNEKICPLMMLSACKNFTKENPEWSFIHSGPFDVGYGSISFTKP